MHVEQGPVLVGAGVALGVVASINGNLRFTGEMRGVACHAGPTPMDRRRDAVTGIAELALYVERRASAIPALVGTVGLLQVPHGFAPFLDPLAVDTA